MGELTEQPKRRGRPPKNRPVAEHDAIKAGVQDDTPPAKPENPLPAVAEVAAPEPTLTPQQIAALDRDYDGEPGGSLPHASLSDRERQNYVTATMEAYSQQTENRREDGFGRLWTFRIEAIKGHTHVVMRVQRGPREASRSVSTAFFTPDHADAAIRELDRETER